jgi:F-type H+-transporting ATPase subunit delta
MARRQTAARRYAEAAFDVGRSDGTLDRWEADFAVLREAMGNGEFRAVLDHPGIDYPSKERIVRRVGKALSAEALNLVLLMVRRGRPRQILPMVDHFAELLRRERGIARAEVRSALALGPKDEAEIVSRLREMVGSDIELRVTVDPELIGGIAVRIGDQLYDGTVRSRLERLRARLTAA